MTLSVTQNVLRLNVSMTDSLGVNVGNGSEKLITVEFDNQIWHHLLHLQIILHHSVSSVLNIIHHHVQVYLIWLLTIRVEGLAHLHTVRMVKHLQNLQFTVLVPFVLEHFLDSDCFACFCDRGLKHNTKRTISNNFFSVISK